MLDFLTVATRSVRKDGKTVIEVRPEFDIMKSKDLMIRAGDFYCVFDESTGLWDMDEDKLIKLIDSEVKAAYGRHH